MISPPALSETWIFRKCGFSRCPRCESLFVPANHYAETWCAACAPAAERDLAPRCERPHAAADDGAAT